MGSTQGSFFRIRLPPRFCPETRVLTVRNRSTRDLQTNERLPHLRLVVQASFHRRVQVVVLLLGPNQPFGSFEEMTSNPEWAEEIRKVYENDIERVDLTSDSSQKSSRPASDLVTRHFGFSFWHCSARLDVGIRKDAMDCRGSFAGLGRRGR
jgi:hypothetical protein